MNYLMEQGVEVWAFVREKLEQDIEGKLHYVECPMDKYREFSIKIGGGRRLLSSSLGWGCR